MVYLINIQMKFQLKVEMNLVIKKKKKKKRINNNYSSNSIGNDKATLGNNYNGLLVSHISVWIENKYRNNYNKKYNIKECK